MTITEQAKAGLIDDLNRNITILRQLAKGHEDTAAWPRAAESELRTLANCTLALCVIVRGAISATGGDKFDLAALAALRKQGDDY